MKKKTILFVCAGPGGVNVAFPVIKKLINQNNINVKIFASETSEEKFLKQNISFVSLKGYDSENFKIKIAEEIIKKENPAIVVTSFGEKSNYEYCFRLAAKKCNIPVLFVLDQWMNYLQRFNRNESDLNNIPDVICVMDNVAKKEMIEEGFKSQNIVITGNPYFDDIFLLKEEFNKEKITEYRKMFGIRDDEFLITFASEPMENSENEIEKNGSKLKYTEKTVVTDLLSALESISIKKKFKMCLIIKLHPKETKDNFDEIKKEFSSEYIRLIINDNTNPRKLILSSNLIVGMSSMFLIESVLLGKLTVSIQPGSQKRDLLVTNRVGASVGIYNKKEIEQVIEKMIFDERFQKSVLNKEKLVKVKRSATDNIMELLKKIMINKRFDG